MKRSDLFRRYAEVIDMCESTDVKPHKAVKLRSQTMCGTPDFDSKDEYTFALAIVEDKPVFAGDVLYGLITGFKYIAGEESSYMNLTWTNPNPFSDILKAQAEGKRIVFFDGAKWVDTDVIDTVNFKPESYRVAEPDYSNKITIQVFGEIISAKYKKCGITGKISAEVIE